MQRLYALLLAGLLLAGSGISGLWASGSQEGMTLRVGTLPNMPAVPLIVAGDQGFFQNEGIAVEIRVYNHRAELLDALEQGQLDGAVLDAVSSVTAVLQDKPLRIVAAVPSYYGLYTAPGSSLDLEGLAAGTELQTGVHRHGSSAYMAAQFFPDRVLPAAGLRSSMCRTQGNDWRCWLMGSWSWRYCRSRWEPLRCRGAAAS